MALVWTIPAQAMQRLTLPLLFLFDVTFIKQLLKNTLAPEERGPYVQIPVLQGHDPIGGPGIVPDAARV